MHEQISTLPPDLQGDPAESAVALERLAAVPIPAPDSIAVPETEAQAENELLEFAARRSHLHAAEVHAGPAISPRHHQEHLDETAFVAGIERLNPAERDIAGAALEVGSEALDVLSEPDRSGIIALAEQTAGQSLHARTSEALRGSEFVGGVEVAKGVESYFEDHYALAGITKDILENDIPPPGMQAALGNIAENTFLPPDAVRAIINYSNTSPSYAQELLPALAMLRMERVKHPEDLSLKRTELQCTAKVLNSMFAEASIGVTLIGDTERQLVTDLVTRFSQKLAGTSLLDPTEKQALRFKGPDAALEPIDRATETFWKDSRHAGQLLFHTTQEIPDIYQSGHLYTRRMQQAATGIMNANSGYSSQGNHLHSPTLHWSEFLDPRGAGRSQPHFPVFAGTLGVEIGHLIKSAPYGRDAHYAEVSATGGAAAAVEGKVPVIDTVGHYGGGAYYDKQGDVGADRTFYASPHDVDPDTDLAAAPDGYGVRMNEHSVWVHLDAGDYDARRIQGGYGVGEHLPRAFAMDAERPGTSPDSYEENRKIEAENYEKFIEGTRRLQAESIARYPGQYVVPVRAGLIEFSLPDDNLDSRKPRAGFTRLAGY